MGENSAEHSHWTTVFGFTYVPGPFLLTLSTLILLGGTGDSVTPGKS
jgi:hypothetical protein